MHMILTVSSWQDGAKGHGPTKQRFTNTCRCVAPSVAVLLSCFVVRWRLSFYGLTVVCPRGIGIWFRCWRQSGSVSVCLRYALSLLV
jgi:hypothetical protein